MFGVGVDFEIEIEVEKERERERRLERKYGGICVWGVRLGEVVVILGCDWGE